MRAPAPVDEPRITVRDVGDGKVAVDLHGTLYRVEDMSWVIDLLIAARALMMPKIDKGCG